MKIEKKYTESITDDKGHSIRKGDTLIYSRADGEEHIGIFDSLNKGLLNIKSIDGKSAFTLRPKNVKSIRVIKPIEEITGNEG